MPGKARGWRLFVCVFCFIFCKSAGLGGLGVVTCGAGGATAGMAGEPPGSVFFLLTLVVPHGGGWGPQSAAGEAELGTAAKPPELAPA